VAVLRSRLLPVLLPALLIAAPLLADGTAPALALPNAPAAGVCDVSQNAMSMDPEELAALADVNAYRASYGESPLAPSQTLTRAAAWKSGSMAAGAPFGHDDSFRSWWQRLGDCGYPDDSYGAAENIAAGETTGGATVADWEKSPPHNENLLNPTYTAAGLKRVHSANPGDPYGWYWTLDFGGDLDAPLGSQ
jgi:uncharacterized protein YkwD